MASDPAYRRSKFRGFDHKETCTVDPRSAKSRRERGKVGPQDLVGNRCQGVRPHHEMPTGGVRSGFRGSGFVLRETLGTTTADFPIGKSPTQEKVDPLTIGVRDLEGSVHGATGLANSRPANSRFLQVCGPKPLNIASSGIPMRVNVIISVRN
jgi:hypothetical protein